MCCWRRRPFVDARTCRLHLLALRLLRARDQVAAPPRLARLLGVVVRGGRPSRATCASARRRREAGRAAGRPRAAARRSARARWASRGRLHAARRAAAAAAATSARHVSSATPAASCTAVPRATAALPAEKRPLARARRAEVVPTRARARARRRRATADDGNPTPAARACSTCACSSARALRRLARCFATPPQLASPRSTAFCGLTTAALDGGAPPATARQFCGCSAVRLRFRCPENRGQAHARRARQTPASAERHHTQYHKARKNAGRRPPPPRPPRGRSRLSQRQLSQLRAGSTACLQPDMDPSVCGL